MTISDRITVLRKGKVVEQIKTSETNERKLARKMVGTVSYYQIRRKPPPISKDVVLEVKDLEALNDKGLIAINGVSFNVHENEILGIAGVAGNGQKELAQVITNLRNSTKGRVRVCGRDVTNKSPREVISQKVAYIPESRMDVGLIMDFSVAENAILKTYELEPCSKNGLFNPKAIEQYAIKLISEYDVKTPFTSVPIKKLSGGNIQKLLLARELDQDPKLIIAAQPTRGLDIKATKYIQNKLIDQRNKGAAILLISEDLEELIMMSNTIAVIYEGKILGLFPSDKANMEEIGLLIAGID